MALYIFCVCVHTHRKVNEIKNKTEVIVEHYIFTTLLLFLQSYHHQKRSLVGTENLADGDDYMHP